MKIKLLVDKDDGRRSGAAFKAGDIVEAIPADGIPRNGDGTIIVYWVQGVDFGVWEGQFELLENADAQARAVQLSTRQLRYLKAQAELTEKLHKINKVIAELDHQMEDPWHR